MRVRGYKNGRTVIVDQLVERSLRNVEICCSNLSSFVFFEVFSTNAIENAKL